VFQLKSALGMRVFEPKENNGYTKGKLREKSTTNMQGYKQALKPNRHTKHRQIYHHSQDGKLSQDRLQKHSTACRACQNPSPTYLGPETECTDLRKLNNNAIG